LPSTQMITPLQILTKDNALNWFQELAGNML
jgi:hypothetical protein